MSHDQWSVSHHWARNKETKYLFNVNNTDKNFCKVNYKTATYLCYWRWTSSTHVCLDWPFERSECLLNNYKTLPGEKKLLYLFGDFQVFFSIRQSFFVIGECCVCVSQTPVRPSFAYPVNQMQREPLQLQIDLIYTSK